MYVSDKRKSLVSRLKGQGFNVQHTPIDSWYLVVVQTTVYTWLCTRRLHIHGSPTLDEFLHKQHVRDILFLEAYCNRTCIYYKVAALY